MKRTKFKGRYNKKGKWIIEEVKKLRPYFETEVVKVGKPKPKLFCCSACGTILPAEKSKGNWVNGENLDMIRFPCFCSYSDGEGSERKKGFLSMNNGYYYIANINNQKKLQNDVTVPLCNLKQFITSNNIHILKGKIIIFEEE